MCALCVFSATPSPRRPGGGATVVKAEGKKGKKVGRQQWHIFKSVHKILLLVEDTTIFLLWLMMHYAKKRDFEKMMHFICTQIVSTSYLISFFELYDTNRKPNI